MRRERVSPQREYQGHRPWAQREIATATATWLSRGVPEAISRQRTVNNPGLRLVRDAIAEAQD